MHVHILGICGTFMGGLAVLASELNHQVSGSDQNVYPPMSTQLDNLGIKIFQGYEDLNQLNPKPDVIIVGNVMTRGIPVVEALLNRKLSMSSGPEWLARYVLHDRKVLAISGTHGKTTTSSMVAWILEYAGLDPGFLIGGVPKNFGLSARLGSGPYFVLEADEYDSAFFDKRSKFVHYQPWVMVINNIEYDHADIFPHLAAIQQQFHHCVRTVASEGRIVHPEADQNVLEVLKKGCWTPCTVFTDRKEGSEWKVLHQNPAGSEFEVGFKNKIYGTIKWGLLGQHNIQNALAAIAASQHVGVDPKIAIEALCHFEGVKRRLEVRGVKSGVTVYDDFAHHPTAIRTTLSGLRAKVGKNARIVAVLDIRSNTMKAGHHQEELSACVESANQVYFFHSPDLGWDVKAIWQRTNKPGGVYSDLTSLGSDLFDQTQEGDHLIFMSNGGFGGIHQSYLESLASGQTI